MDSKSSMPYSMVYCSFALVDTRLAVEYGGGAFEIIELE